MKWWFQFRRLRVLEPSRSTGVESKVEKEEATYVHSRQQNSLEGLGSFSVYFQSKETFNQTSISMRILSLW